MDNLEIYNRLRSVPQEALKPIQAGRLKGMSDINPMWRIKMLTEAFGPCGFGWRIDMVKMWLEQGAQGVVSAFVQIALYVKRGGEWSAPIPGIGGAAFVAQEKQGLYTSDEAYKMAYTDAISVACKMLGMAADVYYAKDRTKYTEPPADDAPDYLPLAMQEISGAQSVNTLIQIYNNYPFLHGNPQFMAAMTDKRKSLEHGIK